MKCTSKKLLFVLTLAAGAFLTGCGQKNIAMPYSSLPEGSPLVYGEQDGGRAKPFSGGLCLVEKNNDRELRSGPEDETYRSAALFDVNRGRVIYSEAAFDRLYPASMTKVMTAILVMKYCQKDDVLTCSPSVKITESGAQLMGLEEGDTLTMDQAMHALLMYSANDAAVAIAEHISGSVEEFGKLMTREAQCLGAQGTNFKNPHGLHDDEHYTTAYDMYLMFNEATKHDWFNNIISTTEYTSSYKKADGSAKEMSFTTTNLYLKGDANAPEGITIVGGKTGTTNAAGNNLVLLSRDGAGGPYISVVMRVRERGILYSLTTELLKKI